MEGSVERRNERKRKKRQTRIEYIRSDTMQKKKKKRMKEEQRIIRKQEREKRKECFSGDIEEKH